MTANEAHDEVLAALLTVMNDFEQRGYEIDVVTHAALRASAYYAAYSLQAAGTQINSGTIGHMSNQLQWRMREYAKTGAGGGAPGETRVF